MPVVEDSSSHVRLESLVREVSNRVDMVEKTVEKSVSKQDTLVSEIHQLTSKLSIYIDRQESSARINDRIWRKMELHENQIHTLQTIGAADKPVIDSVRDLQRRIVVLAVTTALSPVAALAAFVFLGKGPA